MISLLFQASLFIITTIGGVIGVVKGIEVLATYAALRSLKK